MRINTLGLITYSHPHLKTEQALLRLQKKGMKLKIYALPFAAREPRKTLFSHRPDQRKSVHPSIIAKAEGIPYMECETDREIDGTCEAYLVLAGKILSPECVKGKKILNCHPGIIPAVRGLDAFKWAVWGKHPLGVTLHYIDETIDGGEIIAIVPTPVYSTDTPEVLARRHYENELSVQCDFEYFLEHPVNEYKDIEAGEARRRMGNKTEMEMMEGFQEYIRLHGKH
ncbi:MAG: formyltransferase family protein [Patescibacteria group bacterium]